MSALRKHERKSLRVHLFAHLVGGTPAAIASFDARVRCGSA